MNNNNDNKNNKREEKFALKNWSAADSKEMARKLVVASQREAFDYQNTIDAFLNRAGVPKDQGIRQQIRNYYHNHRAGKTDLFDGKKMGRPALPSELEQISTQNKKLRTTLQEERKEKDDLELRHKQLQDEVELLKFQAGEWEHGNNALNEQLAQMKKQEEEACRQLVILKQFAGDQLDAVEARTVQSASRMLIHPNAPPLSFSYFLNNGRTHAVAVGEVQKFMIEDCAAFLQMALNTLLVFFCLDGGQLPTRNDIVARLASLEDAALMVVFGVLYCHKRGVEMKEKITFKQFVYVMQTVKILFEEVIPGGYYDPSIYSCFSRVWASTWVKIHDYASPTGRAAYSATCNTFNFTKMKFRLYEQYSQRTERIMSDRISDAIANAREEVNRPLNDYRLQIAQRENQMLRNRVLALDIELQPHIGTQKKLAFEYLQYIIASPLQTEATELFHEAMNTLCCCICMEDIDWKQRQQGHIYILPCGHYMHKMCLISQLSAYAFNGQGIPKCPMCRAELAVPQQQEEINEEAARLAAQMREQQQQMRAQHQQDQIIPVVIDGVEVILVGSQDSVEAVDPTLLQRFADFDANANRRLEDQEEVGSISSSEQEAEGEEEEEEAEEEGEAEVEPADPLADEFDRFLEEDYP